MQKKKYLRIVFVLLFISLLLPLYYVYTILLDGMLLRKIIAKKIDIKSAIEYFNFTGLQAVLQERFNNTQYTVYAFADRTKGIAEISRNNTKKLTLNNTEIYNVHGTAKNNITKDVYQFEGKLMNISEINKSVRFYHDFNIKLKSAKKDATLEMRGDNLSLNTITNTVYSDSSVMFHAEDTILIGGNFHFTNNTIKMNGDIFIDSPKVIITSKTLTVMLDNSKSVTDGSSIFFTTAVFGGGAKLFDKENNTNISANTITVDYKKKLAILEGSAKISRQGSVATGSVLTYNLTDGVTTLRGNGSDRVKIIINY